MIILNSKAQIQSQMSTVFLTNPLGGGLRILGGQDL